MDAMFECRKCGSRLTECSGCVEVKALAEEWAKAKTTPGVNDTREIWTVSTLKQCVEALLALLKRT